MLYRSVTINLKGNSTERVQFVGVYALNWEREWGRPALGFVEVDNLDRRSDLMGELKDFLDYLLKEGYCDSDVYDEEPTAIDRYMETK